MATLAALPLESVTPETLLDVWDDESIRLENIAGPIAILNNVHPDKAVRDAADASMRELAMFTTELFQNEALFERVRAVEPRTRGAAPVQEGPDRGVRGQRRRPPAGQARPGEGDLGTLDGARPGVRHATSATTRRASPSRRTRCEGLPEAYLGACARATRTGNYVLGFDYPDYVPFMTNARTRRRGAATTSPT